MGVVNRRWVWVESMGVVVRRHIDFLILLIPTIIIVLLAAVYLYRKSVQLNRPESSLRSQES